MRVNQLLESKDESTVDFVADYIKKDCQPFLQAGAPRLWRGFTKVGGSMMRRIKNPAEVNASYAPAFYIGSVKNDRKPKDMPESVHAMLNKFFTKHVGVPLRSSSLFVTGDWRMAGGYGDPYVIFPIGEFHYAWAPSIGDAYHALAANTTPDTWAGDFGKYMWKSAKELKIDINGGEYDIDAYQRQLQHTFDKYGDKIYKFDTGLDKAVKLKDMEIMLVCDKFYALELSGMKLDDYNAIIQKAKS